MSSVSRLLQFFKENGNSPGGRFLQFFSRLPDKRLLLKSRARSWVRSPIAEGMVPLTLLLERPRTTRQMELVGMVPFSLLWERNPVGYPHPTGSVQDVTLQVKDNPPKVSGIVPFN
ncbi:hypothetical protein ACLOJK_002134 [Asimina triloba]